MGLRKDLALSFLEKNNYKNVKIELLASDASFRSYHRVYDEKNKAQYVLMDAPPEKEEIKPFVNVAEKLVSLGFSAPKILQKDYEKGFLLLEDLGDKTYNNCLKKGYDEKKLYELATDVLIELNSIEEEKAVPKNLEPYDDKHLLDEALLLVDWYIPNVKGLKQPNRQEYINIWQKLFKKARKVPNNLVLRDYHIDNLLLLEERSKIKACGLLDFQDALKGPITYDIMSLLEDARRDIDENLVCQMKERYFKGYIERVGNVCSREDFEESWAILSAQRHAKVIGIFTRLCVRDNKKEYLKHIPRVWRLFEKAIEKTCLSDIKEWVDINVPKKMRIIPDAI